jgi:low temperature requirement protein LtrA
MLEHDDEHQVTPLELFFDLVFVFALTQVTSLLAHDPPGAESSTACSCWAAIWWAWGVYAWLTPELAA